MTSPSLDQLSDLELAAATHQLRKLVSDTNQAVARSGPHAGWSSLIGRLECCLDDYRAEYARRIDAPCPSGGR